VIDGGVVGRCCGPRAIQARALPLAWLVRHGQQGHVPADFPIALVEQVSQLRPEGAQVMGLGDGARYGPATHVWRRWVGPLYVARGVA
jgi:hypothetical protein